ncbi:MAG TPA: nitrite/sulfite reductase [Alphaproteobacteria bacterium]|jgi:sulfite reductase (NADPH) hemoprotein beta-component
MSETFDLARQVRGRQTPPPIDEVNGSEPLASVSDADEFRAAYAKVKSGEWDATKWQGFRLRFGLYGQLQPNVHMLRIKVPGGLLPFEWANVVAEANRKFGGAKIHVSTRQDLQIYFIKPDEAPDLLQFLYERGLTTREACGNTLRNMTSCQLAGICPREHVDAGKVADQLALSWIRHPLVQHMPRKFKITVSGCETDCASSSIHDLGLVAVRDASGKPGFKAYAGGGTGGIAIPASLVADFVEEKDLPAVVEALVRIHHRYSNRRNRNQARIKFVNKRFGAEKFRALYEEEFARTRTMPQRPWQALEWRQGENAPEPVSPGGIVQQHDGKTAVVVKAELGLFSSDELDKFVDIAKSNGSSGLRTTREQNIVIVGLEKGAVGKVVAAVRAMGFGVENHPGDVPNVVACPGTTTCGIGITTSQTFGLEVQELATNYKAKPNVNIKISGCQNGCGLHHVADFGFRGMGKKIGARNAPHYQIYVGGEERKNGHLALLGPVVPARLAKRALELLMDGYAAGKQGDESVRDWSLRLGKDGIRKLIEPVEKEVDPANEGLFFDFGEDWEFSPPAGRTAECAVATADDDVQKDLADDALISTDRALAAGFADQARAAADLGFRYSAQRLRIRAMMPGAEDDSEETVISTVRTAYFGDTEVIETLDRYLATRSQAVNADGQLDAQREALALWQDTVEDVIARPVAAAAFAGFGSGLDDSAGSSVLDMIKGQ